MRILIVDDSPGIRNAIGSALARDGHNCDFGENGIEGLRLGLKKAYELILSDIQMPLMDGLKFISRLRMGGPNVKTPILVFSSCQAEEAVLTAAKLGIQGYVLKPADHAGMIEAVGQIFRTLRKLEPCRPDGAAESRD